MEQIATGHSLNLLTFQLAGERYGLNVTQVLEIYPLQPITPMPRTPDFVVGFFSARGRFISVVDLRRLLGQPANAVTISPESSLVVIGVNDLEVAFLADVVDGVQTVFENELEPPLATPFTRGIAPGMTAVLDLHTLFNRERLIINEET